MTGRDNIEPVRRGIPGTGGIAHACATALMDTPGATLAAVGSRSVAIATAIMGSVEKVQALAEMSETGVDAHTGFNLLHVGGGMSICSCSGQSAHGRHVTSVAVADGDAVGWAARVVPTPYLGNGYVHEAIEASRCVREGLLESRRRTLGETLALMPVLDTIGGQIGLRNQAGE